MSTEQKENFDNDDNRFQSRADGKENFEQRQSAPEVEAEKVNENNSNKIFNFDLSSEADSIRRLIFALCYFWEVLFFIPLIMYKDSKATRHANEGLVILLFSIGGGVIYGILISIFAILGLVNLFCLIGVIVVSIIFAIYAIGLFVLKIIGIIYALTDKDEALPILGKIKILK